MESVTLNYIYIKKKSKIMQIKQNIEKCSLQLKEIENFPKIAEISKLYYQQLSNSKNN